MGMGSHMGDADVKTRRQLQLFFDADCGLFPYWAGVKDFAKSKMN